MVYYIIAIVFFVQVRLISITGVQPDPQEEQEFSVEASSVAQKLETAKSRSELAFKEYQNSLGTSLESVTRMDYQKTHAQLQMAVTRAELLASQGFQPASNKGTDPVARLRHLFK